MKIPDFNQKLRFYFITDENATTCSLVKQVEIAVLAGATMIQYRNKSFSVSNIKEVDAIRHLCRTHSVPFIVNDDILLAKAVAADGVHLGKNDAHAAVVRDVLGPDAVIGISVSHISELEKTNLSQADYIGVGPVFSTNTKADTGPVIGLTGLKKIVKKSLLPVVAIGGIDDTTAKDCFETGAFGVAVISCITRADDPESQARAIADVCGCHPRSLISGWDDEFGLIDKLLHRARPSGPEASILTIPAGDDAALFKSIQRPVITTDTHKENVHFRRDWQTLAEIGRKAVEVTFSDLAASYAVPLSLFVNLSLPSYLPDKDIENLYQGIYNALDNHQATLGGGNVSKGREFSIDLFAIGNGHPDIFPLRSNAQKGDGVYVTGPLGLARAGLACLENNETDFPDLIKKFKYPCARFDAAWVLAEHNVNCVMDISDGLAGDARHIATAADISIRFEPSLFHVGPSLKAYCQKYQTTPEKMILAGGEDYELMFTCKQEIFAQIKSKLPNAFQVGSCQSFEGTRIVNLPTDIISFQHGSSER